jgi:hypothetical protein
MERENTALGRKAALVEEPRIRVDERRAAMVALVNGDDRLVFRISMVLLGIAFLRSG